MVFEMKKKFSSIILMVLAVAILMAGCRAGGIDDNGDVDTNGSGNSENSAPGRPERPDRVDIGPRPVYDIPRREKSAELFPELRTIVSVAAHGTGLYVYGTAVSAPGDELFYFCDFEDGSVTPMFSLPDDFEFYYFRAMPDGSLLVAGVLLMA
jgi:hypothetical protein